MSFQPLPSPNLQQQQDRANRVADEHRPNFMLFVCPLEWTVDAEGDLMPTVVTVGKLVGSGAVTKDGDFSLEQRRHERAGRIPIPHDVLGPDQDYVAMYLNKHGKPVCRSVFQTGVQSADGVTHWLHDSRLYKRFIGLLRRRGIIPHPQPHLIEGLIKLTERQLEFVMARTPSGNNPELQGAHDIKIGTLRQALTTLDRELSISVQHYGSTQAPGASALGGVLDQLESEADQQDHRRNGAGVASVEAQRAAFASALEEANEPAPVAPPAAVEPPAPVAPPAAVEPPAPVAPPAAVELDGFPPEPAATSDDEGGFTPTPVAVPAAKPAPKRRTRRTTTKKTTK